MTYGELLEKLYELSPSQLKCDVTVEIAWLALALKTYYTIMVVQKFIVWCVGY